MLLRDLAYLVALAHEQHYERAARACNVTRRAVSSGIQRLESQFGVLLVRRGHLYGGLTPEGERVLRWAYRFLADMDGLQMDLNAMHEGVAGHLRVGVIPTALPAMTLLTNRVIERHPLLDVTLESLSSREIEAGLYARQLDLGMTYLRNEPLREARMLPLYDERYVLLTAADGVAAGARTVTWAEAARERLCLLSPDMQHRRIVNSAFAAVGEEPRPILETNSISTLYAHASAGLGSAVMAHAWLPVFHVPETMRAVPLVQPDLRQAIGLVWFDLWPEPAVPGALLGIAGETDLVTLLEGGAGSAYEDAPAQTFAPDG